MLKRCFTIILVAIIISIFSFSCERRTNRLSSRIYDLVHTLPVEAESESDSIVVEVLDVGRYGLELICSQILSPGKGNDSSYRLMVEMVSQYLSVGGTDKNRILWEEILVENYEESLNIDLKEYFLGQLNEMGSDYSGTFEVDFFNSIANSN